MAKLFANSGDPDQIPHSVASDLGLHCLPSTLLRVPQLQWVKWLKLLLIMISSNLGVICLKNIFLVVITANEIYVRYYLKLSMLGKKTTADDNIFLFFPEKDPNKIPNHLMKTICKKCCSLFSGKNKTKQKNRNISSICCLPYLSRVVKVQFHTTLAKACKKHRNFPCFKKCTWNDPPLESYYHLPQKSCSIKSWWMFN